MSKYELLAKDIYDWCKKNSVWDDNTIYFDGKAWSSGDTWGKETGKKIAEDLYEYENKNPCTYFEYGNPETLSMSFEGGLYDVLNGYFPGSSSFEKVFEKYGLYYEFGYSWSLSAYEI